MSCHCVRAAVFASLDGIVAEHAAQDALWVADTFAAPTQNAETANIEKPASTYAGPIAALAGLFIAIVSMAAVGWWQSRVARSHQRLESSGLGNLSRVGQ